MNRPGAYTTSALSAHGSEDHGRDEDATGISSSTPPFDETEMPTLTRELLATAALIPNSNIDNASDDDIDKRFRNNPFNMGA